MTRRLWFDLAATLRLAEHALICTQFDQQLPGGPNRPCLILTLDRQPKLFGNGLPALRGGNHTDAVHIDVLAPKPAQFAEPTERMEWVEPPGHLLLPLAGVLFMKLLRAGTRDGHCWFLIDVAEGEGGQNMRTRATRDVDTIPETVERVAATVTAGRLGPYPARVARGYQHAGAAIAWLDLFTCDQLATDTQALAAEQGGRPVVRVTSDEVWLVHAPGTAPERAVLVARETGGWYRITHPSLPWAATPIDDSDDPDAPLFTSCGPDGESMCCTVCGAVNEIDHQEMPSMVGYGHDTHTACGLCASAQTSDPMFGMRVHRAVWPPSSDSEAHQ